MVMPRTFNLRDIQFDSSFEEIVNNIILVALTLKENNPWTAASGVAPRVYRFS